MHADYSKEKNISPKKCKSDKPPNAEKNVCAPTIRRKKIIHLNQIIKKGKDTKIPETEICLLIVAHKECKFDGLSDEQDPRNLINGRLFDSKYSVHKKKLVHEKKLSDEDDS